MRSSNPRSKRKRAAIVVTAVAVGEAAALWLRTGRPGGNIVVRCRHGHLYTTLWLPAVSVKSLRLGLWRFQHCPVGHHWSLVTPVGESSLSDSERRSAHEHHDIRLP